MKRESIKKYVLFLVAMAVLAGLDQWTKKIAEDRLATQNMSHMYLEVEEGSEGVKLFEFLDRELRWNSEAEVDEIARLHASLEGGARLSPESTLEAGQVVEISQRDIVVIEDFWDFQYTRNPGAAFGILADADEDFRKPFFIIVSLLAVGIILGLLHGITLKQQLLFWGLTLIAAGAVGNFMDRLQFGYVVDFIVWKYTDEHRWPTFNLADVWICMGVGLMALEMVRDTIRHRKEGKEGSEG